MKRFIQFLFSKIFVVQLVIAAAILFASFYGIKLWLNSITQHGTSIEVPDFKGVHMNDLERFVSNKNVNWSITDSIYSDDVNPGEVLKQEPKAGTKVKKGREIFVYVAATMPASVIMPKLVDCSFRQALSIIRMNGLEIGKVRFVKDECNNCVIGQVLDNQAVPSGVAVYKGSKIDLIVGKGLRDSKVSVPCLKGLTRIQAINKLAGYSLSLGKAIFKNNKNRDSERVYKQFPACEDAEAIEKGSSINLFFSSK